MTTTATTDHRFIGYFDTNEGRTLCRSCGGPEHAEAKPRTLKWTAIEALAGTGVHLIDATYRAPGVLKLTVTPGHARTARNAMIQAGLDAATTTDHTVTVTDPS